MSAANNAIPPASLSILISTLATQAPVSLGEVANPATNQTEKNLPLAKHLIDTLEVLEAKTTGNRDDQESQLLHGALHQLRMLYVATNK